MSSGSSGVMNVWFSRVKISWMTSSPSMFQGDDFVATSASRELPA